MNRKAIHENSTEMRKTMEDIKIHEMDETLHNKSTVRGLRINTTIPKELKEMKLLEILVLEGKNNIILPEWLTELECLGRICLKRVDDNFLSEENCRILNEIPNLQRLEISDCYLPKFPSNLLSLTKLEHLSIRGCQLKELPEEIRRLSHLKTLDVSFNDMRKLPKSMDQLRNLEELIIVNIGLADIPKVIQMIPRLMTLDISSNPIRKISDPIFRMKELKYFSAVNCGIDKFPSMLLDMPKLISLDLSYNDIASSIPDFSWKKNFQSLTLRFCHLKEFPKGVTEGEELELLDLSDNKIEVIPSTIEKLRHLQQLLLSGNSIQSLPQELTALSELQRLELPEYKVSMEEVKKIMNALPSCSCNLELTPKEKEAPWLVQIMANGIMGKNQKKYKAKEFAMIIYDVDEPLGYRIMVTAETIYELILQAADIMDMDLEDFPMDWETSEEYTEIVESRAAPKVKALLHYLEHHFDFNSDTDDSYFEELSEAMPKSKFIAGWSACPPYQDEAYAIILIPK